MKEKNFQILTYFCLSLSLVSTITYMIYTILTSGSLLEHIISIISVFILAVFSVVFVFLGMFANSHRTKIFIIILSLLLTFYSLIQVIFGITRPKDFVLNFVGMDIKEVVNWAEERNILIEQVFENSDNIKQYQVIRQSVKEGTATKKVDKIIITVSDGPNLDKEAEVTNMVGWKLDDVIKFIDDNHLTNVDIQFEFHNQVEKDIIFEQNVIAVIKRNDPIILKSSLGKENELKTITMESLIGMDLFHATIYLKRNHINYSIIYSYSEDYEEDIVMKQSIPKWEVINPKSNIEVVLTVSRKNNIIVPDLSKMTSTEIVAWTTENRLKVKLNEEFHDTIEAGKVISFHPSKNNILEIGDLIEVTISKGPIYMIEFTTMDEFKDWADENNVIYDIDYKFSNSVSKGKLISSSHKKNQIIRNGETVKLVISEGGNTIVPNLIGMTKEEAKASCINTNIQCNFIGDSTSESTVIKQSMRSGSNVQTGTTVTVTMGKN